MNEKPNWEPVRPARPHTGVTDDGRRIAVLTTYTRRGSRLSPRQQQAWERRVEEWLIPDEAVDDPAFSISSWFGRENPLMVEIGSGMGEAVVALAARHPEFNVLAMEVWRPGVAATFVRLESEGLDNVRCLSVDAVWSMEHLVAPDTLAELWTFFPDPWHKKRHHRRRLVNSEFARLAASRLARGAVWRLATDWPDYADQIQEVLAAEPALAGGPVERWSERPVTKFERRGIAEGRPIADFTYVRV